jgi:hypothetical protein
VHLQAAVRLEQRAYTPVPRKAALPENPCPGGMDAPTASRPPNPCGELPAWKSALEGLGGTAVNLESTVGLELTPGRWPGGCAGAARRELGTSDIGART